MLLEGKVAIVTGAARGTGEAIARRFVAEGATVALADVRVEQGTAVADSLGASASFHQLDVTDAEGWASVVDAVMAAHGRIDVLVNNAAILHLGRIETTDLDTFRHVFDVNAAGAYAGIAAVVPHMRAGGGGSIVNIASIDALQAMNGLSAYATSKWAMRGLTKAAAVELGRDGIRVNAVCPAGGNPAMYGPWGAQLADIGPSIGAYMDKRAIPREATTDEIAAVALFLASDLSVMVTGADVPIDGGHTAGDHVAGFDRLG
jgi:3alpha(or 20beta)-hydroxysteroid dehydrogenase